MSKETITLIAAIFAALASIAGLFIKYRLDATTEFEKWRRAFDDRQGEWLNTLDDDRRKWERAWSDEVARDIRKAIGELATKIAAGIHTMQWFTWKARKPSYQLTEEDSQNYDEEMHALFPGLVGPLIVLATLDDGVYTKMDGLVNRIIKLDVAIAETALDEKHSPGSGRTRFDSHFKDVDSFYKELPKEISQIGGVRIIGRKDVKPRT